MSVSVAGAAPRQNIVKAAAWTSVAIVLVRVFFLVSSVVTARTLTPHDFGLIGIAGTLSMLINTASATGIDSYLIFRQNLNEREVNTSFTLHAVLCGLFSGVVMLAGVVVAAVSGKPELRDILFYSGLAFFVNSIGRIPRAFLIKAMKQDQLAMIDTGVNFLNLVLILVMAGLGFQYLSYVIPMMVAQAICAALLFWRARQPFRLDLDRRVVSQVLSYSKGFMPQTLLCDFLYQADYVVGGLFLTSALLGYYYFGFEKAFLAALLIRGMTDQVFFPIFSAAQNQPEELKKQYFKFSSYLMFALFPLFALGIFFARDGLLLVYGRQWENSIATFQAILGFCLLKVIYDVSLTLLNATGKTRQAFWHFVWVTPHTLILFALGAFWGGLQGLTLAALLSHSLSVGLLMFRVRAQFGWPVYLQAGHVLKHLALLAFPCAVILPLQSALLGWGASEALLMPLLGSVFIAVYLLASKLLFPEILQECRQWVLLKLKARFAPHPIA